MPTTLIAGLLVGLLGSFIDDLAGSGGLTAAVQVVLWVAAALLIASAVVEMVRAPRHRPVAH